MVFGLDLIRSNSTGRCHHPDRNLITDRQQLRRRQPRSRNLRTIFQQRDRDQAGFFLEHDAITGDGPAVTGAGAREHKGGADVGMARKRHFRTRREDPYLRGMCAVLGRQYEGSFSQIEFRGDALHLLRRQPFRVQHHRERVAAEPMVREYIDGLELQAHLL